MVIDEWRRKPVGSSSKNNFHSGSFTWHMLIKARKFRAASNTDKNIINFYSAASGTEPRAEHRNLHPATLIACLLARVSHIMALFPLT